MGFVLAGPILLISDFKLIYIIYVLPMQFFYYFSNKCPNCGKFARTGKLDRYQRYNSLGVYTPLYLKNCLNCDFNLETNEPKGAE